MLVNNDDSFSAASLPSPSSCFGRAGVAQIYFRALSVLLLDRLILVLGLFEGSGGRAGASFVRKRRPHKILSANKMLFSME